jgi:hypothetical protein
VGEGKGGGDSLPVLSWFPGGGAVINKLATCFGVNYRDARDKGTK